MATQRYDCIRVCTFYKSSWILFEDNVKTPWSYGLNVLGIGYQEKIYSGCLECVACGVLADELLYS